MGAKNERLYIKKLNKLQKSFSFKYEPVDKGKKVIQ